MVRVYVSFGLTGMFFLDIECSEGVQGSREMRNEE